MTVSAKRFEFSELQPSPQGKTLDKGVDNIINNMEVECQIRIGTVNLSVSALRQLTEGQVIQLNESIAAPVDILLDGRVIARGELLCCDDYFGIKLTETA